MKPAINAKKAPNAQGQDQHGSQRCDQDAQAFCIATLPGRYYRSD